MPCHPTGDSRDCRNTRLRTKYVVITRQSRARDCRPPTDRQRDAQYPFAPGPHRHKGKATTSPRLAVRGGHKQPCQAAATSRLRGHGISKRRLIRGVTLRPPFTKRACVVCSIPPRLYRRHPLSKTKSAPPPDLAPLQGWPGWLAGAASTCSCINQEYS